jgi:hypothetical protein
VTATASNSVIASRTEFDDASFCIYLRLLTLQGSEQEETKVEPDHSAAATSSAVTLTPAAMSALTAVANGNGLQRVCTSNCKAKAAAQKHPALEVPPCSVCLAAAAAGSSAVPAATTTAASSSTSSPGGTPSVLQRMNRRRQGLIRRQSVSKPHLWPHVLTSPVSSFGSNPSPIGVSLAGAVNAVIAAQPSRSKRGSAGASLQGVREATPSEERGSLNAGEPEYSSVIRRVD